MAIKSPPRLLTTGVMAEKLGVPIHRVIRIVETRSDIHPVALAGRTRLYSSRTLARIRHELAAIDARRESTETS